MEKDESRRPVPRFKNGIDTSVRSPDPDRLRLNGTGFRDAPVSRLHSIPLSLILCTSRRRIAHAQSQRDITRIAVEWDTDVARKFNVSIYVNQSHHQFKLDILHISASHLIFFVFPFLSLSLSPSPFF